MAVSYGFDFVCSGWILRIFGRLIKLACLLAILPVTSCDTVAELSFRDEQLVELVPGSLLPGACLESGASDAVFAFSVLTSSNARMTPGDRYAALGDPLEPGRNFVANDVQFSDGWFFVVDTVGRDTVCETADDCIEGASCKSADEMGISQYYYAPGKYCVFGVQITAAADPSFYHYRENYGGQTSSSNADGLSFAFVIDNSATLDGSFASGVPDASKATDPFQYRIVGLNQFMDGLQTGDVPKVEFSAHFANGIGENGVFDISKSWMRTFAVWESAVMQKYPSPSGASPIWETASAALAKVMDSANTAYMHTMVALTDGAPNDNTDEIYRSFSRQLSASDVHAVHWLDFGTADAEPNREYAEIAAQSCGTYALFSNASQFSDIMRQIAINVPSHWVAGLKFSTALPAGHIYRLATNVVIRIGHSAVTFEAQRKSDPREAVDDRLVLAR